MVATTFTRRLLPCLLAVLALSAYGDKRWTEKFNLSSCQWSSTGRNDYFILEPGYEQVFEGKGGRLVITVLPETRKIGGVETRVVQEHETQDGKVIEVSRNFFAVCRSTNDIFYFGEDVDMYKDGKVTGHEGSWIADKDDAKPGLFMPGTTLLGSRFYQEIAPSVAMDRVEIASDSEVIKTPAGVFRDCLETEETTPLEPKMKDHKTYARGVGLIKDGEKLLTKYGFTAAKQ